jgi:hypothetical protein
MAQRCPKAWSEVVCMTSGPDRRRELKMAAPLSIVDGLLARLHGPMSFRFLLQPLVAFCLAFRDGRRDSREGRAPFLWALFTDREHRRELLLSGWKSIGKVFVTAIVIDIIFQYVAFHELRLRGGALLAGVILALVPYVLLRGPVNRLSRRKTTTDKP